MKQFDYEGKVWGANQIAPTPFFIQGLKLRYTLEDLCHVKGKILDVGCGAGNMAKAIKAQRPDLEVYGVDISRTAIIQAKKNPGGVSFRLGTAEEIPFSARTFDAVTLYDVLEHVENPTQVIAEVKRVLKPGGLLHIFSPLDREPWTFYALIFALHWQPKNEHTGHIQVFTDKSFRELLQSNRFSLLNVRFSFHWLFSIFDIGYFSLLELLHLHASSSIEGMLEKNKKNVFSGLANAVYRTVVFIGYYESRLLSRIPGGGGHYLFTRD